MRHLDGLYTQKFNRVHHRDGPLFRGRYKAILIDAEEYFQSVVRYIRQNPLRAEQSSGISEQQAMPKLTRYPLGHVTVRWTEGISEIHA